MADIKVNIVHAKIRKAAIEKTYNMIFSAHPVCNFMRAARVEFCCDNDFMTLCKIVQRASQILLAGAALITGSGIKKVYTKFQTAF